MTAALPVLKTCQDGRVFDSMNLPFFRDQSFPEYVSDSVERPLQGACRLSLFLNQIILTLFKVYPFVFLMCMCYLLNIFCGQAF